MEEKKYYLHPRQMFLPLAISVMLCACSASLLVMAFSNPAQWTYWVLGIAGVYFFGVMSYKGIKQVRSKKVLLTLDAEGFTDCTLYNTPYTVKYEDVQTIHSYNYRRKKFIGVNLKPEAEEAFLAAQAPEMAQVFVANKDVSRFLVNLPLDYIYAPRKELEDLLRSRCGLED